MVLPRRLEPEVMDSPAEARDYDAMDHGEVNRCFVSDLLSAGLAGGTVLDLGTGTALVPIELCLRCGECRVEAIDMAGAMLALARRRVTNAGFEDRIHLVRADAKQLPFRHGTFDAVISNSIVHHIAEPSAVLAETWRVARRGGLLFFRDLLRPQSEAEVGALVDRYAGNESEHGRAMFADSLRAALSLEEVRARVGRLGGDPREVRQTSDRHWTWAARKQP